MRYCKNCKIQILDQTNVCPFCRNILDKTGQKPKEPMYPPVSIPQKKYRFLMRLIWFVSISALVLLSVINYLTFSGSYWSVICDAGIMYFMLTLRYSLFNDTEGHLMKIMVQTIAAMGLCILIDVTIGYSGWSINYAIPCANLLVDIGIVVLMIVNMENWQSYILLQLAMVLICVIALVLVYFHIITRPLLSEVAAAATFVLFLGTVVFGDRRAKNELKRRFHV